MCLSLRHSRASYYRFLKQGLADTKNDSKKIKRKSSPRKISNEEKEKIMSVLHSPRFVDKTPATIVAILLDEKEYLCSVRSMYRFLAERNEIRERRNFARKSHHKKPELLAIERNQVWSWDITKLKAQSKWNYFYLYVIMDIFSRKVVGWSVYNRELAVLAENLIAETVNTEKVDCNKLTIHSDNGAPMKSKLVAELLVDLQITPSFSRPSVSNDNPFSEAGFKTLKYSPEFPENFGSLQEARSFCQRFFNWYNNEHRHSGIAYFTPNDVHSGRYESVKTTRNQALEAAWQKYPERFVKEKPEAKSVPPAVWINPPKGAAPVAKISAASDLLGEEPFGGATPSGSG